MKNLLLFLLLFFGMNVVYGLEFDQFDSNDINSLREATKYYQQEYDKKRGTIEAEEDYDKFLDFRVDFYTIHCENIYLPYKLLHNSVHKQIKAYSKQYYKYGLVAQFDEGEYMLVPSRHYLYKNFGPYLPKSYRELLKFHSSDKRTISDCRFIVPISYFENKIKFYKKYAKKYPDVLPEENLKKLIESIKEDIERYPNYCL